MSERTPPQEKAQRNLQSAARNLRAVVANSLNEAPSLAQRHEAPSGEPSWKVRLRTSGLTPDQINLSIGERSGILLVDMTQPGEGALVYKIDPDFAVSVSGRYQSAAHGWQFYNEVPKPSEVDAITAQVAEALSRQQRQRSLGRRVLDTWQGRKSPWMLIGGRGDWQRLAAKNSR